MHGAAQQNSAYNEETATQCWGYSAGFEIYYARRASFTHEGRVRARGGSHTWHAVLAQRAAGLAAVVRPADGRPRRVVMMIMTATAVVSAAPAAATPATTLVVAIIIVAVAGPAVVAVGSRC